jgi:hypothetical protein
MAESDLTIRLDGLAKRINAACGQTDTLPAFIHWSDAQLLIEAILRIRTLEQRADALNEGLKRSLAELVKSVSENSHG